MKNFGLIYQYEMKKIIGRKHCMAAFLLLLVMTLLINFYSVVEFSVGHRGESLVKINEYGRETLDYGALLHGIPIRYVDGNGQVVEEKVGPFQYLRMKREFAMEWSEAPLDNELIREMQEFIKKYDYTDEAGRSYGWSFQNYYWVYKTIVQFGLNPEAEGFSEEQIRDEMEKSWEEHSEAAALTEKERTYWSEHARVEYPLKIAYLPAYQQMIENARWIHILLTFYVIFILCDSCSLERTRKLRQMVLATQKGTRKAVGARLCAGMTVAMFSAIVLYVLSSVIQFGLFGTDRFHTPVQQIDGLHWSRLIISAGEAMFLVYGTNLLLIVMMGAITMLLSELFQNAIVAITIPVGSLIYSLLFERPMFYEDRLLAQVWRYFPLQRIDMDLLYDERFVSIGKHLFTAIPFSTGIYLIVILAALALCAGIAFVNRRDRR